MGQLKKQATVELLDETWHRVDSVPLTPETREFIEEAKVDVRRITSFFRIRGYISQKQERIVDRHFAKAQTFITKFGVSPKKRAEEKKVAEVTKIQNVEMKKGPTRIHLSAGDRVALYVKVQELKNSGVKRLGIIYEMLKQQGWKLPSGKDYNVNHVMGAYHLVKTSEAVAPTESVSIPSLAVTPPQASPLKKMDRLSKLEEVRALLDSPLGEEAKIASIRAILGT